jgi:hypothetical protein
MAQPAGRGATLEYTFRNGNRVHFAAHRIHVERLLEDVKAFIRSNPKRLDWRRINVADLGMRLVENGEKKYVGKEVADWRLDLDPAPNHFDRRITVTTPLQDAGAIGASPSPRRCRTPGPTC